MSVLVKRPYTDFVSAPGNIPDYLALNDEINNSSPPLTATLVSPFTTPNDMNPPACVGFYFDIGLDGPDNTQLDVIVAAHTGTQLPDVLGTYMAGLSTPTDPAIIVFDPSGGKFHVFELESGFERSEAESQHSAGPALAKIDETPTLIAGTYRVEWCALVGGTLTSTESEYRVIVDAVTIWTMVLGGLDDADNMTPMTGFDDVVLAAGARNLKIEIEKTAGGGSARISNARLAWRRVGL